MRAPLMATALLLAACVAAPVSAQTVWTTATAHGHVRSEAGNLMCLSAPAPAATRHSPRSLTKHEAAGAFLLTTSDWPATGLFDPTPVAAAPGNVEPTRGAQRRRVIEHALQIVSRWISSPVPIRAEVSFGWPWCDPSGQSLISAGMSTAQVGFFDGWAPPGVREGVWYPGPLYEALTGTEMSEYSPDIRLEFAARLDNTYCGLEPWYYGIDPSAPTPPGTRALLPVVLHQLMHALGIASMACGDEACNEPGDWTLMARPSIYDAHLRDAVTGAPLAEMAVEQRGQVIATGSLAFVGEHASQAAATLGVGDAALRVGGSALQHLSPGAATLLMQSPGVSQASGALDLAPAMLYDLGWPMPAQPPVWTIGATEEADPVFSAGFE